MRKTAKHSRDDDDGIRVIDTRTPRKLARLLLGLVAALVLIVVLSRLQPESLEATPVASETVELGGAGPEAPKTRLAAKPIGQPVRQQAADAPSPDEAQAAEEAALEREIAKQPTFTISPPGSPKSGMALFPAPGSDPLLRGLVVPDDFPLPEGYVRHHQVTDDGDPLPPILMFSPDFDWVDQDGAPIALPADRVVPPELAPEGMPIQPLAPPGGEASPDPSL